MMQPGRWDDEAGVLGRGRTGDLRPARGGGARSALPGGYRGAARRPALPQQGFVPSRGHGVSRRRGRGGLPPPCCAGGRRGTAEYLRGKRGRRERPRAGALPGRPFARLCGANAAQAVASSVTDTGSAEPAAASRGQAEAGGAGKRGRLPPVPPEPGHPPLPALLPWEAAAERGLGPAVRGRRLPG